VAESGSNQREIHMMRFAAGLTATGIIGFLLLEALKILMVPITAWVLGLLALALKVLLITLGIAAALGAGIFFYRRSKKAREAA
jgi:hypothetical protein